MISAINEQIADWKRNGAHILAPMTLQTVPAMHRPVLAIVQIDPDPKNKEVYPQKGGGLSLSAIGWKKLADAMRIQWIPEECRQTDDGRDPNRCAYRMVGRVKSLDGTWRRLIGDKEVQMDVVREELQDSYREKARAYQDDPKDGPAFRRAFPTPEAIEGWIQEKVRQDALQIRKHRLSRAQTGALARAVKSIGVRETYSAAELAKPFVFPMLVPEFDPNHPGDRAFLRAQAVGAIEQYYPERPAPPAPEPPAPRPSLPGPEELVAAYPEHRALHYQPAPASPPLTPLENLRADFYAADAIGQREVLERLIRQKGYAGKVQGQIEEWSLQQRAGFFDRLIAMPDVAPAARQTDELPFD